MGKRTRKRHQPAPPRDLSCAKIVAPTVLELQAVARATQKRLAITGTSDPVLAAVRMARGSEPQAARVAGHEGAPPNLIDCDGIPEAETRARTHAMRNTNHCVVCRLQHLGYLKDSPSDRDLYRSDLRHKAAERLQDDYAKGGMSIIPGSLAAADTPKGGFGPRLPPASFKAGDNLAKALFAVGHTSELILQRIVLEDYTLGQVAEMLRWRKTSVLPALRSALDVLVRHYGFDRPGARPVRTSDGAKDTTQGRKDDPKVIHPFNRSA